MTQIRIEMRDALHGQVELSGHAGDDRICAAVSTVVGAALNTLGDAAKDVVYESGNVRFRLEMQDGLQMGAMDMMVEAFEMLAENFPECVGVTMVSHGPVK